MGGENKLRIEFKFQLEFGIKFQTIENENEIVNSAFETRFNNQTSF